VNLVVAAVDNQVSGEDIQNPDLPIPAGRKQPLELPDHGLQESEGSHHQIAYHVVLPVRRIHDDPGEVNLLVLGPEAEFLDNFRKTCMHNQQIRLSGTELNYELCRNIFGRRRRDPDGEE